MKNLYFLFVFLFFIASNSPSQSETIGKLPKLNIDQTKITASGVSAGAYMAVQLNVALSSVFTGIASIAGGIYWCSEGNVFKAQVSCIKSPSFISVASKIEKAKSEEAAQNIDSLQNIQKSRIYAYASPKDGIMNPDNTKKLIEFYSHFTAKENIFLRNTVNSGHGWITNSYGNSCEDRKLPWLNNCHFDLAGDFLTHFYGHLNPPKVERKLFYSTPSANLFKFDQSEFNDSKAHLYPYGWVYIPAGCSSAGGQKCKLHVALHGCQMNPDYIQDIFVVNSGINGWAETNNIVVLYPQNEKSLLSNPYDCWDWWGYSDSNFANRKGPQIVAIQKMVYRLLGLY